MTSPGVWWPGPPSFTHSGSPAHPATFWKGCVQEMRVALSRAAMTAGTRSGSSHPERGCRAVELVCASARAIVGWCLKAYLKPVSIPTARGGS